MEPECENARATLKDVETRGVAWKPNQIWFTIGVAECVLWKKPCNLFGCRRLDFDHNVSEDELSPSAESGVDAIRAMKASGSSSSTSKQQANGPEGKAATQVAP